MATTARSALVVALLGAALARGQPPEAPAAAAPGTKRVVIRDQKGRAVGKVLLMDTPHGLLVRGVVKRLPTGAHAIHFHETGKCEAPFKTAGGHFNPTQRAHGLLDPGGLHAGDLPNLVVPKNGTLAFEVFAADLTLADGPNTVLDGDGTALVIHARADDYRSQPSGEAGDRIACGVISR